MTNSQHPPLEWEAQPFRKLTRLAGPIVINLLSFSFMTMIDTLFVGRLGVRHLAAVGMGGIASFAILCFGLALFGGAKVMVGQAVGAGRDSEVRRLLGAFIRLSWLLGFLSLLLGLLVAMSLPWVNQDPETGALARSYTCARAAANPVVLCAVAIAQWRQARGDSKGPMRAALIGNLCNVPLNAYFIFVLDWGVTGVGVATTASRIIECLILVARQRSEGFYLASSAWADARRVFLFAWPAGLERWLEVMSFATLVALLSQLEPEQMAAHQIGLQLLLFAILPLIAVSEAVSIMVSQAAGALRPTLGLPVMLYGISLMVGYAALWSVVAVLWGRHLAAIFTTNALTQEITSKVLLAMAVFMPINAVYVVVRGALRGAGELRFVAWVTVLCSWLCLPPLTLVLGLGLGLGAPGAWSGLILEVALGALLTIRRIRKTPLVAKRHLPEPATRATAT